MTPPTKISLLRSAWSAGDQIGALRIAAKFPRLGPHKAAITRAWAAHVSPDLYRQMNKDPDALIAAGFDAMREMYELD